MKKLVYKTISEFHEQSDFPPPENPLFSVIHTKLKAGETSNCEDGELTEPISLTNHFYSISSKKLFLVKYCMDALNTTVPMAPYFLQLPTKQWCSKEWCSALRHSTSHFTRIT